MVIAQLSAATPIEATPGKKPQSPPPEVLVAATRDHGDTVSISGAASQPRQTVFASTAMDNAAADVSAVSESLRGQVSFINGMRGALDPENIQSFRNANGEEATQKYIQHITLAISQSEQSLTEFSAYVASEYGAVGTLPAKQEGGAWSPGSVTLSRKGEGFEVRAESGGNVRVSKGGSPFEAWAPDGSTRAPNTSTASIALQLLRGIDYKV